MHLWCSVYISVEGGLGLGCYKPRPLSDVTVRYKALTCTVNTAVFRGMPVHSCCMWQVSPEQDVRQDSRRAGESYTVFSSTNTCFMVHQIQYVAVF